MFLHMISLGIEKKQIFRSVIQFIAVFVVYDFFLHEKTSQHLLHNIVMLIHLFAVNPYSPVSLVDVAFAPRF